MLGDDSNVAGVGVNVTFNVCCALYDRVTGDVGQAKLNIGLIIGEYLITSKL